MRIDAYNQVAQVYGTQRRSVTRTNRTAAGYISSDQVSISQTGYDYQIAKKAVSEASDIREDKVAQLKAKVEAGEYQVEPDDFASKLLERYNSRYYA